MFKLEKFSEISTNSVFIVQFFVLLKGCILFGPPPPLSEIDLFYFILRHFIQSFEFMKRLLS